MTHARLLVAVALALPLVAGCGGAVQSPSVASASKTVSSEELSTLDGASAAVDHAEHAIDAILGPVAQAERAPEPPPPPPPPASAPAPAASAPPAPNAASRLDADEAPRQPTDACSTACSALASMERATAHLCDLAGGDDARCSRARTRVENASARVHARCPACRGS
jgi:hypothetical protein